MFGDLGDGAESVLTSASNPWFVTTWPGRIVSLNRCEVLFAVEMSTGDCVCAKVFAVESKGWEHQALYKLATARPQPHVLVTDNRSLLHALVTAGSGLKQPTSAFLHIPVTNVDSVRNCITSLNDTLNNRFVIPPADIGSANRELEEWRKAYNNRNT
ncbi:hypothetical protein PMI06_003355 [Burkholderia sp. BT03]|nr:hypothetical protein PMI06_003355 [Burkholderia sp. BT03]SKC77041.1 hypothetical protein SAMN06266956_3009 [Paraburkholderia hospita]